MSGQMSGELTTNERAELEVLRDLRATFIGFGGDDFTIAPWIDMHRRHKDEPYIGCPFCRPKFVEVAKVVTALHRRADEMLKSPTYENAGTRSRREIESEAQLVKVVAWFVEREFCGGEA